MIVQSRSRPLGFVIAGSFPVLNRYKFSFVLLIHQTSYVMYGFIINNRSNFVNTSDDFKSVSAICTKNSDKIRK